MTIEEKLKSDDFFKSVYWGGAISGSPDTLEQVQNLVKVLEQILCQKIQKEWDEFKPVPAEVIPAAIHNQSVASYEKGKDAIMAHSPFLTQVLTIKEEGKGHMPKLFLHQDNPEGLKWTAPSQSVYTVINGDMDLFVAAYKATPSLKDKNYRVRIQGSVDDLQQVTAKLQQPFRWDGATIKSGDHLSIVTTEEWLPNVVADAIRAIMLVKLEKQAANLPSNSSAVEDDD